MLYVGATPDVESGDYLRISGKRGGFLRRYCARRLVFVEAHPDLASAVARSRQIERWVRAWKITLIEEDNPAWNDLAVDTASGLMPIRSTAS